MMQNTNAQAAGRPYPVFNPAFAGYSNERLYAALCDATASLDAGLQELHRRLKPIILNTARGFLNALSWTMDNAMGEALIFLWDLVRKHSFKEGRAPFDRFFGKVWRTKLNDMFSKLVMKTPILLGDMQTGCSMHQPVFCCAYGFHEKAAEYREKRSAQQAAWYDKKLAKEGKTRQPKKQPMSDEERREKNRIRAAARFAALTPEQKRAQYDRDNERRRAKRAAMTPEEKAKLNAKEAARMRARNERKKAQQAAQAQK